MDDKKRLLQTQEADQTGQHRHAGKDWKAVKDREEELRSIAPLFQKMEGIYPLQPSSQEWRSVSQNLARRIANSKTPLMPTIKDRLTSTDSEFLRWFWIIVALLVIILVTISIAISVHAPVVTSQKALTYELPTKPAISISSDSHNRNRA